MITDPKLLFGPEYESAVQEVVMTILVSDSPVDIIYKYGPMQMSLLPPGGYVIRYVEGSFSVATSPPAQVVGGEYGLRVRWKSSISTKWTELPFPCECPTRIPVSGKQQYIGNPQFHLEITRPHRLQLVPPKSLYGSVKVRVLRYVSPAVEVVSEH